MGYYRSPEWRELAEHFDEWWFITTEFVNDEGCDPPRGNYTAATLKLVASLHDLTRLDPQPVWDVYIAIEGWHKRVRPESLQEEHRERYPIPSIGDMIRRVQLHQSEIIRQCIVAEDPETTDPDKQPDGPGSMKSWWHEGVEHSGMPPTAWLAADALFQESGRSLHADDLCRKVQPDEGIADRDKARGWAGKANSWFKAKKLPLRISRASSHYTLTNLAGSEKEPVQNL